MKKLIFAVLITLFLSPAFAITGEEAIAKFKARMYSVGKMTGNISWTTPSGQRFSGNFKFMSPGRIYIKFSNPSGKIIVSNGKKLFVYSKASNVCGIQDLGRGYSGGIAGLITGYNLIVTPRGSGYTIKLKHNDRHYSQIILLVTKSFFLKKAILKTKGGTGYSFSLSNVNTSAGIMKGLFDFRVPPNAQTVINPLNIK